MQNPENKSLNLSTTASIFNPEITITDEHWAVSFAKHSRDTEEENSHHGILIIQSDTKLYRREILPTKAEPTMCRLLKDTRTWNTPAEFERQVKQLLWKDEDSQSPMEEIAQHTWSITNLQGMELLNDIEKDKENPPPFFKGGKSSVFKPDELKERTGKALRSNTSSIPLSALACLGAFGAIIDLSGHVAGSGLPIPPFAAKGAVCVAATTYVYLTSNAFLDKTLSKRQHNCATWCVEKLTNLNIPEINKDLGAHFTDKFAYVTGLHIAVDEADRASAKELLIKGIKKEAIGCLAVKVSKGTEFEIE